MILKPRNGRIFKMKTDRIYVSVTSIHQHQRMLLQTLKSIKSQTLPPDQCFVYLSDEPYLLDIGFKDKNISDNDLKNFINENSNMFSVIWVKNTGPYRKLLNILHDKWDDNCAIITIDDDTVYHKDFIQDIITDYNKHQCCIGNRCWELVFDNIQRITYRHLFPTHPVNLFNFHTGKGGVLYQPEWFHKTEEIVFDESLYTSLCKTNDDIWFNFLRIANNIPCANGKRRDYMTTDLSRGKGSEYALYKNYNSVDNANTKNIRATVNKLIDLGYLNT